MFELRVSLVRVRRSWWRAKGDVAGIRLESGDVVNYHMDDGGRLSLDPLLERLVVGNRKVLSSGAAAE